MMKYRLIITFVLIFFTLISYAQFWILDFEKAKQIAKENDRNIILVFSGSDWCAPCIKLEKTIWDSEIFQNSANGHFVMLRADFPKKKRNKLPTEQADKNKELADIYNKSGAFPLVVVMDKNGKVLGKTGFKKINPQEYFKLLTTFE